MSVDGELRSLASLPPKAWWQVQWSELSPYALLQYWHRYITIRTHLQLAIMYENDQELAFNFSTCLGACQELVERYISLRHVSPDGFFANPVIGLQAFTGAIFVLLAAQRSDPSTVNADSSHLIDEVIQTLEHAANTAGREPVHQAAETIRSLRTLLELPQACEPRKISLHLPLVGRIHVTRKSHAVNAHVNQSEFLRTTDPEHRTTTSTSSSAIPHDSLSLSMKIPEDYSFLIDQPFEIEDWLTWTM